MPPVYCFLIPETRINTYIIGLTPGLMSGLTKRWTTCGSGTINQEIGISEPIAYFNRLLMD